jgi:aspartyl-tRNA(Asn)/glutamyl-tRNA(Gln) amidotransferase subunit A
MPATASTSPVIYQLGVCEIAELVRSGDLSAAEVVEHSLERIEERDTEIGAFVHVDADRARTAALDIDNRRRRDDDLGPLAGVPFGVKELQDVSGWPHSMAAVVFEDRIAETTATQVERLIEAGGIPIGLTASPEIGAGTFTASKLHGVCRNPWDTELTPGGSSGGSSAAVTLGLVPMATGSDSGGSLRIPAAYTGTVGFKPTYGLVPRGPGYVGFPNVRCYGVITRTVADTARCLDCTVGPDERDPLSLPHPGISFEESIDLLGLAGTRFAWTVDLGIGDCAAGVAMVSRRAAEALADAASLTNVGIDVVLPDPADAWITLAGPDTHALYDPFLPERAGDVNGLTNLIFRLTKDLTTPDYARAALVRDSLVQALADVFERVDLLMMPTTPVPAFAAEGPMPTEVEGRPLPPLGSVLQTYLFNISGHPAISVPAGMSGGAPVGLQIVGRRHSDLRVLAAARVLERTRPWPLHAPAALA